LDHRPGRDEVGVANLLDAARLIEFLDVRPCPQAHLPLASADAQAAGGAIFAPNCVICHRYDANGHGQRRERMSPPPVNLTLLPWSELANAGKTFLSIRNGVPQTARPSWPAISDQQIRQLVAYIAPLNKVR
jgi:mono/diheme cytochrome c family protein